jgi:predicted nucleic acid-binding protein
VKLAADANVLLSASLGGAARLVLRHPRIAEVLTTEATLGEVQEYAAHLAAKKGLSPDTILMAVAALPVSVVPRTRYARCVSDAKRRIGKRDPDDVELLAMALCTGATVWSNDNDFEDASIEWFTTAELLKLLNADSRGQ